MISVRSEPPAIGTEIEFSYNFTGAGFMCNPCLGIKWCFDYELESIRTAKMAEM